VYIRNLSTDKAGTGFLVSRRIGKKLQKIFLVSNKHILMPRPLKGEPRENKEAKAKVTLNRTWEGKLQALEMEVILRNARGKEFCIGHPNKEVDVAALHFTKYVTFGAVETVPVIAVADIGVIFRAETIKETIDQFGVPAWKPDSK